MVFCTGYEVRAYFITSAKQIKRIKRGKVGLHVAKLVIKSGITSGKLYGKRTKKEKDQMAILKG
jgi:hypothetical protein